MELGNCIPADKFDEAAVRRAAALGFPTINPIIPDLLVWLQDRNWPVCENTASLLAKAGPEIAPHLVEVFRGDDDIWKQVILVLLAGELSQQVWSLIRPDLERIANRPTSGEIAEGVRDAANDVLTAREAIAQ